jgi:RNA polymerase sigma-70 factor (ECF subfamily)
VNVVSLARPAVGRREAHARPETAVLRIVDAARLGDRAALQQLHDLYAERVQRAIGRIVGDAQDAEDLTQELFIKLMRILQRFEPQGRPFGAWLMAVARNAALDHLRAARPVTAVPDDVASVESSYESDLDLRTDLMDALRSLSEEQRSVVVLRHLVGLSANEVASLLGRSSAAIHSLDHRARVSLRRDLSAADAAPAVQLRDAPLTSTAPAMHQATAASA